MILVIGSDGAAYVRALEKAGLPCRAVPPSEAPSLTALIEEYKASGMVLLEAAWSAQHVVAAARSLHPGRLALPGELLPDVPARWVSRFNTLPELINLFAPEKAPAQTSPHTSSHTLNARRFRPSMLGVRRSVNTALRLAVAGSRSCVGCTCQAFSLWHFCKSLGFSPLLIVDSITHQEVATAILGNGSSPDVVLLEGIPLSTCEVRGYDCYIYDIGILSAKNVGVLATADAAVLVIGVKPWELRSAIQALQTLPDATPTAVLIFMGTQEEADPIRSLLDMFPTEIAVPVSNIYQPDAQAMELWNRLLLPDLQGWKSTEPQ